jgi:hypothetical protein
MYPVLQEERASDDTEERKSEAHLTVTEEQSNQRQKCVWERSARAARVAMSPRLSRRLVRGSELEPPPPGPLIRQCWSFASLTSPWDRMLVPEHSSL